jgi:predicted DNA-binding protein
MTRDSVVQIGTTAENKNRLKARADQNGQSLSEYGHELIEDHLDENIDGSANTDTRKEMADSLSTLRADLMGILAEFRSETAPAIQGMQSVRTAYLIAIWKLLETEYSAEERRYAMRFAAAHVGINPAVLSTDPSPDVEETDEIATETLIPALASVVGSGDDR